MQPAAEQLEPLGLPAPVPIGSLLPAAALPVVRRIAHLQHPLVCVGFEHRAPGRRGATLTCPSTSAAA